MSTPLAHLAGKRLRVRMRARMFKLARLLVLVMVMCLHPASGHDSTAEILPTDTAADLGQVRLRKLHLVRPDLIPYPISFEVYC